MKKDMFLCTYNNNDVIEGIRNCSDDPPVAVRELLAAVPEHDRVDVPAAAELPEGVVGAGVLREQLRADRGEQLHQLAAVAEEASEEEVEVEVLPVQQRGPDPGAVQGVRDPGPEVHAL